MTGWLNRMVSWALDGFIPAYSGRALRYYCPGDFAAENQDMESFNVRR